MRRVLRDARIEKGLPVKKMASLLGMSVSFYYKIESGLRNRTIEIAKKIADILGRTVDELFLKKKWTTSPEKL